jgi:hypothetical protein
MTVELESQIEAYARWMEDRVGVPLRKPTPTGAPVGANTDEVELVLGRPEMRRPLRTLLLVAAAAVTLIVAGSIAVRARRVTPTVSAGSNGNGRSKVTWYELAADRKPIREFRPVRLDGELLLCRHRDQSAGCAELVGRYTVVDPAAGISISTEYGPVDSPGWKSLSYTAERVDVSGIEGFVSRSGDLGGFEPTPGVRVFVTTPVGSSVVDILQSLERHSAVIDLPVVFGETTATDVEYPTDSGLSGRYFAGYVDARRPCIGGLGMPWNGAKPGICYPAYLDKLYVVVASPSPAGTILIATVPSAATRVEVSRSGQDVRVLPIVEATGGYRAVFADLDAFAPDILTAFDADGVAIDSIAIVSTGGAPLGYVQNEDGAGPRVAVSAANVSEVVSRLGANVPLPPGVSLADIAENLLTDSDMAESTMAAMIEYNAACRWTTYWLDSNTRGDAAAKADAQSHLDALPNRPALFVGDADGGVANMWRNIAAAARAGNPAAVNDAGYRVNCTDVPLQQPAS